MSLIKSISGIRGTIGGRPGDGLSPLDVVKFTAAFATFIAKTTKRLHAPSWWDATPASRADGRAPGVRHPYGHGLRRGRHRPRLNPTTEARGDGRKRLRRHYPHSFAQPPPVERPQTPQRKRRIPLRRRRAEVLRLADSSELDFAQVDDLGKVYLNTTYNRRHIEQVLALPLVDVDAIRKAHFTVAVDAVNSVGGIVNAAPPRPRRGEVIELNCTATGDFAHPPEPIPENLTGIADLAIATGVADVGFVVDPDVRPPRHHMRRRQDVRRRIHPRLRGRLRPEPHPRQHREQPQLLASPRRRDPRTRRLLAAAVGEVNVTTKMKETGAVIGGEGNDGVIYPALHLRPRRTRGSGALPHTPGKERQESERAPQAVSAYDIYKTKIQLHDGIDVDAILAAVKTNTPANASPTSTA